MGDPEEFNPFKGMPLFGDLARLFSGTGGDTTWEAAQQFAVAIATEGTSEANVDPVDRIAIEELARVAELHVTNTTGLSLVSHGRTVTVRAVTRSQWATDTLGAYRRLLEPLATPADTMLDDQPDHSNTPEAFFGQIIRMVAPLMGGMTAGSMVGNLARRCLGQYDLPIAREGSDIMIVPANLDELINAWSLDRDDLRLWVCLHELIHHAVLSLPHVRKRLGRLLEEYADNFQRDPTLVENHFGNLDPTNPEALEDLQSLLGDPDVILGVIQSPAQQALLPQLSALVTVIVGYADWVLDQISSDLIGSHRQVREAFRRRRVEAAAADRFVERLFGLEMSQDTYDRGTAFAEGVVERAGTEGLARLWASERELPTPAEVDAPGLWLARIDLPA